MSVFQGMPAERGLCEACSAAMASAVLPQMRPRAANDEAWSREANDVGDTRRRTHAAWWGLATIAAVAFTCGGLAMASTTTRAEIISRAPVAAALLTAFGWPVDSRGLDIANVRARLGTFGDKRTLVVEGDVVNVRSVANASPDLRISLRGADGRELYVWTARGPSGHLKKGERARFAARLETPPDGVKDARVQFVSAKSNSARNAEGS